MIPKTLFGAMAGALVTAVLTPVLNTWIFGTRPSSYQHVLAHKHEHIPPPYKPPTITPKPTLTAVTPTPMPGAASFLHTYMPEAASFLHTYMPEAASFLHTYNPTYTTPPNRHPTYTPIYKPLPTNPTTYKPPHYYTTTYPQKTQQYYDHSLEKIQLPTLFYPKKKEGHEEEEEEVFSSDDVLDKKVASKGRNWCRNHKLICSVFSILGKSFW